MTMTAEGDFLGIKPVGNGGESVKMVRPGTLHSLEDVIAWIHNHDGKIDAWWEAQRDWNARTDSTTNHCQSFMQKELKEMRQEIQSIKSRIFYAMGFASALGAMLAMFAERLIGRI